MYYWILFAAAAISGVLCGITNNRADCQKTGTLFAVVFYGLLLSIIVVTVFEKAWLFAGFAVFLFLLAPGVGRVINLLITSHGNEIPIGHWFLVVVFAVGCYIMIAGRLVTL